MKLRRWFMSGAALSLVVGNVASGILPAHAASPRTYKIGVDNAAPPDHDWLFVDFFPRSGVSVHRGDVLDFSWNKRSIDGFHEVAFLPTGSEPQPLATADFDDSPDQIQANPKVFGPSGLPCGTLANPCDFDGSSRISSGAQPTVLGFEYFVKVDVPASNDAVTVSFVCEIHPGMKGSVSVVPDSRPGSSTDQVEDAALAQARADRRGALEAEEDVENNAVFQNADSTRTVNVTAGTATPFVEVAEMLPRKVRIDRHATVKFTTRTIRDIHTVTFPQGHGSDGVDPLATLCEGPTADTLAVSPANCASPLDFETHINPGPSGGTIIATSQTVATSGIVSTPPTPFPGSFSFTFPNEGAFVYQCRIHDHMIGMVVVKD
jgi:plastocyanin